MNFNGVKKSLQNAAMRRFFAMLKSKITSLNLYKSQAPEQSPVELRKEAIGHYYDFVEYLEALILIYGKESYSALVKQLNQLIEKNNLIVENRKPDEEENTETQE